MTTWLPFSRGFAAIPEVVLHAFGYAGVSLCRKVYRDNAEVPSDGPIKVSGRRCRLCEKRLRMNGTVGIAA